MRWLFASYREISASGITIPFDKGWVWLWYQLPIGVLSSLCLPKSHQSFSSVTKCPPLKLVIARPFFILNSLSVDIVRPRVISWSKSHLINFAALSWLPETKTVFGLCCNFIFFCTLSFNTGMGASRGTASMAALALPRRWWRHVRRRDCQS